MLHGIYSNGLAQDLHLIPSSLTALEKLQLNHCGANVRKLSGFVGLFLEK